MRKLILVPDDTHIPFIKWRGYAFIASALAVVGSILLVAIMGLNFGIDFRGGTMVEVGYDRPADLAQIRGQLGGLGLGDVQVQTFGDPSDVIIRVATQPGGAEAQQAVVDAVRAELGSEVEYRRVEVVGPTVSGELIEAGTLAVVLAVGMMLIYIWFRFEWQFSVGAVIALIHDVTITLGLFALLQLEFNLSIIAALLTIVGYSINDTVVVYDRIRENMQLSVGRGLHLSEIMNAAINQTLGRTLLTSFTTLLTVVMLFIFGGPVINDFAFCLIVGVIVGTYSSIFVASALAYVFQTLRRPHMLKPAPAKASPAKGKGAKGKGAKGKGRKGAKASRATA